MPVEISEDGASYANSETVSGAPAVVVSGDNVAFTNSSTGRLSSTSSGSGAIRLDGIGTMLVNEAGGIIESHTRAHNWNAIEGSAGTDTIVNRGLIAGIASLGAGDDDYS